MNDIGVLFPYSKPPAGKRCQERGCFWPARETGLCWQHERDENSDRSRIPETSQTGLIARYARPLDI